jgi:hypothetical protein
MFSFKSPTAFSLFLIATNLSLVQVEIPSSEKPLDDYYGVWKRVWGHLRSKIAVLEGAGQLAYCAEIHTAYLSGRQACPA